MAAQKQRFKLVTDKKFYKRVLSIMLPVALQQAINMGVNMLDTIASRTELPICGVIGGTHLVGATPERLEATIEAFQAMDLQFLALSHCTGNRNIDRLKEAFGDRFIMNDTGHTLNL